MIVQIVLGVVVVAVVLPVLVFAAAQKWAAAFPRLGQRMDRRLSRLSPRLGRWFADPTRDPTNRR